MLKFLKEHWLISSILIYFWVISPLKDKLRQYLHNKKQLAKQYRLNGARVSINVHGPDATIVETAIIHEITKQGGLCVPVQQTNSEARANLYIEAEITTELNNNATEDNCTWQLNYKCLNTNGFLVAADYLIYQSDEVDIPDLAKEIAYQLNPNMTTQVVTPEVTPTYFNFKSEPPPSLFAIEDKKLTE